MNINIEKIENLILELDELICSKPLENIDYNGIIEGKLDTNPFTDKSELPKSKSNLCIVASLPFIITLALSCCIGVGKSLEDRLKSLIVNSAK